MTDKPTEAEVLAVLRAVDAGVVTVLPEDKENAAASYVNDVTLRLSNGWIFVIFNDCDEWDYISEVITPDGRILTYADITGWDPLAPGDNPVPAVVPMPDLDAFEPEDPGRDWGFG